MTTHDVEYDSPGATPEPDGEASRKEFLAHNPGEESLAEIYFPEEDDEVTPQA